MINDFIQQLEEIKIAVEREGYNKSSIINRKLPKPREVKSVNSIEIDKSNIKKNPFTKNPNLKPVQSIDITEVKGDSLFKVDKNDTIYKHILDIYNNINTIYMNIYSNIFVYLNEETSKNIDITRVRSIFLEVFLSKLESNIFNNGEELLDKLKRIDLTIFFGEDSFNCMFHKDIFKSAKIFKNDDGYYRYKCFDCNAYITLIDIIAIIEGLIIKPGEKVDINKFIKIMLNNYKLRIIEDDFIKEQEYRVELVKGYIDDLGNKSKYNSLKSKYKTLTRVLKDNARVLKCFTDYKLACLKKYPLKDKNGEHIFYCTIRELQRLTEMKNKNNIMHKIDKLTQLRLIVKIDMNLEDIEDFKLNVLYRTNIDFKANKNYEYISQFFILPRWTNELLEKAELENVSRKESGALAEGESVRLYQSLGVADRVKPQSKDKPKKLYQLEQEKILLEWAQRTIRRKSTFLQNDYLDYAKKRNIVKKDAIAIMPLIAKTLSLKKTIANKDIIQKYGLKQTDSKKSCFIPKA